MLENIAIIEITGSEANHFLQGQITCNLKEIPAESWRVSAYCLANGRVLTSFALFLIEDNHILIALPNLMCELLYQRLQKYILRQDVKIKIRSDLVFCPLAIESEIGFPFLQTGYKAIIAQEPCSLSTVNKNIFYEACLTTGIAMVTPETSAKYLPQMLCLERLGGLSFSKGCYLGQEGIARAEYKSEIRRHLAVSQVDTALENITIGMSVVNEHLQPIGSIFNFSLTVEKTVIQAVIEDCYLGQPVQLLTGNKNIILVFTT